MFQYFPDEENPEQNEQQLHYLRIMRGRIIVELWSRGGLKSVRRRNVFKRDKLARSRHIHLHRIRITNIAVS